jgi:hypothetical protein
MNRSINSRLPTLSMCLAVTTLLLSGPAYAQSQVSQSAPSPGGLCEAGVTFEWVDRSAFVWSCYSRPPIGAMGNGPVMTSTVLLQSVWFNCADPNVKATAQTSLDAFNQECQSYATQLGCTFLPYQGINPCVMLPPPEGDLTSP